MAKFKSGSENPAAKLTPPDVRVIRQLYWIYKWPKARLARSYGVHRSTVGKVVNNVTWKVAGFHFSARRVHEVKVKEWIELFGREL